MRLNEERRTAGAKRQQQQYSRHHSATAVISSISLQEKNLQLVASLLAVRQPSAIINNASSDPHRRIIDSAFLYTTTDGIESGPPSLKDCAKHVLSVDMPTSHDSVNDARQSMRLLQKFLDAGEKQKEEWKIVRSKRVGRNNDPDGTNGMNSLFVHRIPIGFREEKVKTIMLNHTKIQPSKMGELVQGTDGGYGKCIVFYDDDRSAALAFDKLKGKTETDKGGREQKRIFMKSGEYVFVRRNGRRRPKKENKEEE